MVNLDEVLTFSEAAEKWGLADGKSIRKAVERNRFQPHEIKKSGNVWLTTYDAMIRVFGEPRISSTRFSYIDLFGDENFKDTIECFMQQAETIIAHGGMVTIVESEAHPERIMCILKTKEEFEGWKRRIQNYIHSAF